MNRVSVKPLLAALALFASTAALAQKTQLTVYTALETDQLKAYEAGFVKDNPTIEIKWVRDSTGVITAKLLAEKANPQADVVMGVAASSLALLDNQKMLIPYAPLNLDAIMSQYRDKKNPPAWFGMDVWGATVCFNTVEAAKKNIPKPESWQDMTKPIYKGQIVMPNPASSTSRLVAARPHTMSALGLAFSASSLAVITPVESRTQLISTFGLVFSNASL